MSFVPNVNIELKRYEELLRKEKELTKIKKEITECYEVDDTSVMNVIVELDLENIKSFFYARLNSRHRDYLREMKIR